MGDLRRSLGDASTQAGFVKNLESAAYEVHQLHPIAGHDGCRIPLSPGHDLAISLQRNAICTKFKRCNHAADCRCLSQITKDLLRPVQRNDYVVLHPLSLAVLIAFEA